MFFIFDEILNKMDLQTRKLDLIQAFLKIQSEELISRIEKILQSEGKYYPEENMKPFTVQEFNNRINESMEDSKQGNLVDAEKMKLDIDNWK